MNKSILQVQGLKKLFPIRAGLLATILRRKQAFLHAVDDVSFDIQEGEILGLVGESGCGKTTVARLVLRLEEPTGGKVIFDGLDVYSASVKEMRALRRVMQMVFQDPYSAFNPRRTIIESVSEPLIVQKVHSEEEKLERVITALEAVRLPASETFLSKYPHQLSGGERQRVAMARALVFRPKFIVADEPVSMLDVSIRSQVLNVMHDLRKEFNLTYLFITHDLAIARHMCDRIAVMYAGRMAEIINSESLVDKSLHPYTQLLLSCVPEPDPTYKPSADQVRGEVVSPINPAAGCRFIHRCPHSRDDCKNQTPQLVEVERDHLVACHLASERRSL